MNVIPPVQLPAAGLPLFVSCRGGVERLAFSVLWEMTPDAEAVSVRFTKSVIASRAALTYAQAQTRIDDPSMTDEVTISE